MKKKSAIIIGAGYGGLALANLLGKAGYKVDVFEKNQQVGGRITLLKKGGFTFDLGPSWYLMPEVFEQYYSLFNYSASKRLKLQKLNPGYRVFPEGAWPIDIRGNYHHDKATFEQLEKGAAQKFLSYIKKSKKIYTLSINHFLYSNFSRKRELFNTEIIRNLFKMALLSSRSLHSYVKSIFKSKILQQLLEYHTVFLGGSPFKIPAVYSLMSHLDYESGVFYPLEGIESLANDMVRISEAYDITYHFSSPVSKINIDDSVTTGITLENGDVFTSDIVISNADLWFTETQLVEKTYQTYPQTYWSARESGPSAFILSLGVKGRLPQLLHHNLYFVKDWYKNFNEIYQSKKIPLNGSMYICNPTKTDQSLAPKGHESMFVLLPFPSGLNVTDSEEEELTKAIIKTLREELKIPDLDTRIVEKVVFSPQEFNQKYNAWNNNSFGGESHLLSQSILFRTRNKSKKVKNLYYVGAGTLPGIGLPMCLISAQLTFKRIKNIMHSGPLKKEELC